MELSAKRSVLNPVGCALSSIALYGFVLSGCTSSGGLNVPNVFNSLDRKYGDQSDACYYARKPLIDTGNAFAESMVKGALIGAIVGAGTGAVVSKDKATGAAVGGAVGALAGIAASYLDAKRQNAKSQGELIGSIDADAERDNIQLVTTNNAISSLTKCRQDQVNAVDRDYRSKTITGDDAKAQLTKISLAVRDDNALIGEVLGESSNRSQVYVKAKTDAGGKIRPISGKSPARHSFPPARPDQYVAMSSANIRGGASVNDPVIGKLESGEPVDVASDNGEGWLQINHDGKTGYISKKLLAAPASAEAAKAQKAGPSPSTSATAVATGGPGTEVFMRTNEDAEQREDAHKQVESEVQSKINHIAA